VVTGAPSRFVSINDVAGSISNCGVVGGRFLGTPTSRALSFGIWGAGGIVCYTLGTYFEEGIIDTDRAVNARIDVMGGVTLAASYHLGCAMCRINGVDQLAYGAAITHGGGNLSLDMSKTRQTITLTGTSIQFIGPATSQVGTTCQVTLTNDSGASRTPTSGGNYDLGGYSWPTIADGESLMLQFVRVPSDSGTRVQVQFLSEDFPTITTTTSLVTGFVKTGAVAVGALPSAATAGAGARMVVTDANATTFASVVAGGGANIVPVFSNGTNWRIG
jgi:hypothetical protein